MIFGPVRVGAAAGAVLAHSLTVNGGRLRKGLILTEGHVQALLAAGVSQVTVARLEPGDVLEDAAAERLARAIVPDPGAANLTLAPAFTGRVNILAAGPGVVRLDVAAIERFNLVHPMITIATVAPFRQMAAGGMVATIKIISYAVPGADVERAAAAAPAALGLAGPVLQSAGLVVTEIAGGPSSDKGIRAVSARLGALGLDLAEIRVVTHERAALAAALAAVKGDMVLILTGSATSDPGDVGPEALRAAGGHLERFGMPVDPGNLLFLGSLGARPVIGLPGCARSVALNGADWVLSRVACGVKVTARDIAGMGVAGLLKEIPTRPQPRAGGRRG